MEHSILLVDDEVVFRNRLTRAFKSRGYTVFSAGNYDEAVSKIRFHQPAMAVVDLRMPGKNGIELIKKTQQIHPNMKIVVLTGYGSIATAIEATKLGAVCYLPKPADVDDIISAFARNTDLRLQLEESDFSSPSLARSEWEHINRVLHDCQGNISAAARKLGVHRRTLQRKLRKYPPKQ
ncbi:MAG: response regulator [Deltaproteobacteria bacterium]|nr:response regulator [Deltaproteobacteria bacterium]